MDFADIDEPTLTRLIRFDVMGTPSNAEHD